MERGKETSVMHRPYVLFCYKTCIIIFPHIFMQEIYGMLSLVLHSMPPPSSKWQEIGSMLWICFLKLNGKYCSVRTSCPSLSTHSCCAYRFPKQLLNWRNPQSFIGSALRFANVLQKLATSKVSSGSVTALSPLPNSTPQHIYINIYI